MELCPSAPFCLFVPCVPYGAKGYNESGSVITGYVYVKLVATGGCVVRLWQRGICVYHVWLCSSSWSINHTHFSVFV